MLKLISTCLILLNFLISITLSTNEIEQNDRLLLVISLDGFRYDYLDFYAEKNGFLNSLAKRGVRACWSESIYPTQTYPNHWSIATGLYPETHGIINNDVYDPKIKKYFKYDKDQEDEPGWFENYEPIWITNHKSDLKRKNTVVIDWPGGVAKFDLNKEQEKGHTVRHPSSKFFNITTFNDTVDLFVQSLSNEKTNLAFLYFGEPDVSGHIYGPESQQVETVVRQIDLVLEYLFEQMKFKKKFILKDHKLDINDGDTSEYRYIDLVILTDHGMSNIQNHYDITNKQLNANRKFDSNRHLFLSDYIQVSKYIDVDKSSSGSLSELWLITDDAKLIDELYEQLVKLKAISNGKLDMVYLKNDIPERFYLKSNYRTAPIILTAIEGFQIFVTREKQKKQYFGNHGYDNEFKSMRGIFLAHGHSFKNSFFSKKPIKIIDTYLLLCYILGLQPNPNNGSFSRVKHIIEENLLVKINANKKFDFENDLEEDDLMKLFFYGGVLFLIGLIFISVLVPFLAIFTSIRATCHDQNPMLFRKKKTL